MSVRTNQQLKEAIANLKVTVEDRVKWALGLRIVTDDIVDSKAHVSDVGDKSNLTTSTKTNLVAAINEVDNDIAGIEADNITLKIYKVSNFATQ